MSKKIIKHELFEVNVPAGTSKTQFEIPQLNNLNNVELWGMQVYSSDIVKISVISQKAVIPKDVLQNAFITLVNYAGRQFLNQCPMVVFQTIENNLGAPVNTIQEKDFKSFTGQKVNFPKSFINTSAIPVVAFDQVFLVSVYYVDPAETKTDRQANFRNKG